MKVVFRVDASFIIGIGHIIRCQTLANTLKKQGIEIHFIIRELPGHLAQKLIQEGFKVTLLPPPENESQINFSPWLGACQQIDAEQTMAVIKGQQYDWLIVDHYGLDIFWETQFRLYFSKIMIIDDLANRFHDCDILLDQNFVKTHHKLYKKLVPKKCQLLLGPLYTLLRPEYLNYQTLKRSHKNIIRRVFISMGGTDNSNLTCKIIDALNNPLLAHLEVDIVIGFNFIHKNDLINHANLRPHTNIHINPPQLADLMAKADLAIGAGGSTTWERIFMGLPSIVLSLADNQVANSEALEACGLIQYLGNAYSIDIIKIEKAILKQIAAPSNLVKFLNKCRALVDGKGVSRISQFINPTSFNDLSSRLEVG